MISVKCSRSSVTILSTRSPMYLPRRKVLIAHAYLTAQLFWYDVGVSSRSAGWRDNWRTAAARRTLCQAWINSGWRANHTFRLRKPFAQIAASRFTAPRRTAEVWWALSRSGCREGRGLRLRRCGTWGQNCNNSDDGGDCPYSHVSSPIHERERMQRERMARPNRSAELGRAEALTGSHP
jgi:hypothetical protein